MIVGCCPRLAIKWNLGWKTLALRHKLHIFDNAPDLVFTYKNSDPDVITNFAFKICKCVVRAEAWTIEVNDTDSVCWTSFGGNIVNNRLLVILEATLVNMPISAIVCRNRKVNVSKVVWAIFCWWNRTSNFCPGKTNSIVNSIVHSTNRLISQPKSLAWNDNFTACSVTWTTSWGHLSNIVESKCKVVFIVVSTIKCNLEVHYITLRPAARCNNFDHCVI